MKKSDKDQGSKMAGRTNRQRDREDDSNRHDRPSVGEDDSNHQHIEEMDHTLEAVISRRQK